ncbi:hypothetical protein JW766_00555 [Candidatus Dojkabacteria bacterium]|nr:hypothetical protein [Candidatus Dojkabacteria bacterium]
MRNYNRDSRSGSGRYSQDRKPSMYKAICAECGRSCEVPFKPRGDKPVYCSECFEHQSGGRSERSRGGDSRRRDYKEKRMYTATCDECGIECRVPFRPTGGKPVYCDACFKGDSGTSKKISGLGDSSGLQKQIEILNSKLEVIIHLLESSSVSKKNNREEATQDVKKQEVTKKPSKSAVKKSKTRKPAKGGSASSVGTSSKVKGKKTTRRKAATKKTTKKKAVSKKKK